MSLYSSCFILLFLRPLQSRLHQLRAWIFTSDWTIPRRVQQKASDLPCELQCFFVYWALVFWQITGRRSFYFCLSYFLQAFLRLWLSLTSLVCHLKLLVGCYFSYAYYRVLCFLLLLAWPIDSVFMSRSVTRQGFCCSRGNMWAICCQWALNNLTVSFEAFDSCLSLVSVK